MKDNLNLIREAVAATDDDPAKSLFFYNNPKARVKLLTDIISFSVHHIENTDDATQIQLRSTEILTWLDTHFHQYAWPAHEVHFHTNFIQHCSCPFTCLNEISTIVEKLIKEKFAA